MMTSWNDPPGGFHPLSAADYLPRARLAELQLQRLQAVVARAFERVALFRSRLEGRGLAPAALRSLEDLGRLPFTVKSDLRDTYPFGLFASPMEDIVRLHASSGTTGKPIVVAYTGADLAVWTEVMVRTFAACGLTGATWCRTPTATASSRAGSARTTGPRRSARRSSPSAAATPSGSSW